MKKLSILFCLTFFVSLIYSQVLPVLAIEKFDTLGNINQDEADIVTELLMTELGTKNTVRVVDRNSFDKILQEMRFQTSDWSDSKKVAEFGKALNANCIIRGQLMRMGNVIYMTNTMIDVNTTEIIYSAREQLSSLGQVFDLLPAYCSKLLASIPSQNPFVGKWIGSQGNLTCILELKENGTIVVERYDTRYIDESSRSSRNHEDDKRSGIGIGNYSVSENQIAVSLSLKNVNSKFATINTRADYSLDNSKTKLTFTRGGMLCYYYLGRNVFVVENSEYFTSFTKTQ